MKLCNRLWFSFKKKNKSTKRFRTVLCEIKVGTTFNSIRYTIDIVKYTNIIMKRTIKLCVDYVDYM